MTNVLAAVLVLLSPSGRVPKDRSWKAAKVIMSKVSIVSQAFQAAAAALQQGVCNAPNASSQVDDFLQTLVTFDKEHVPDATVRVLRDEYLSDPDFNPEFVRAKSSAAAGLCAWVINIIRFHEVSHEASH